MQVRFATLALVDAPNDFPLEQWPRLHERAVSSGADLLLEVGRGYGNSTVVLTEAAHALNSHVVSVGFDEPPPFETITWPKLAPVVGERWRSALTVVQADVRGYKPPASRRCFLFWDAHGTGVADAMLNRLIPDLPGDRPSSSTMSPHPPSRTLAAAIERVPVRWRGFVSAFKELPLIGAWLDEHELAYEQDTGMLAFQLPASS